MESGVYILMLRLNQPTKRRIGALGLHAFEPGTYLYVGSARRALRSWIRRHFAMKKPKRWHIDFLTSRLPFRCVGAVLVLDADTSECQLNQRVMHGLDLSAPVARFGASDCRAGCPAHLGWTADDLELPEIAKVVAELDCEFARPARTK